MKKFSLLLLLILPAMALFAQRTITGKITDQNGVPIANASVTVKGSTKGVTSNAIGNYSITVDNNAAALIFSHTGMATIETAIGSSPEINISLKKTLARIYNCKLNLQKVNYKYLLFSGMVAFWI